MEKQNIFESSGIATAALWAGAFIVWKLVGLDIVTTLGINTLILWWGLRGIGKTWKVVKKISNSLFGTLQA